MPPTNHSRLSPSASHRWIECPGSVAWSEKVPQKPSGVYAEEGTAAHLLGERCLAKDESPDSHIGKKVKTPQGSVFSVTEEMVEAVDLYVKTIRNKLASLDNARMFLETPFDMSHIHEGIGGTNDACIIQPFGDLYVFDLKYGAGVPVEVYDNPQAMIYAKGAMDTLGANFDFDNIHLVIIQPRAFHKDGPVREWTITKEELNQWVEGILKPAAKLVDSPNATLKFGDHCRFCPARVICPEHRKSILGHAKMAFSNDGKAMPVFPALTTNSPVKPEDLTDVELGNILAVAELIQSWCGDVKSYVHDKLKRGEAVPGWKLVAGRRTRSWGADEQQILTQLVGATHLVKDCFIDAKIKSPAQMEKTLKQFKIDPKLIEPWITESRGVSIAPESDPRQQISGLSAADVFSSNGD